MCPFVTAETCLDPPLYEAKSGMGKTAVFVLACLQNLDLTKAAHAPSFGGGGGLGLRA